MVVEVAIPFMDAVRGVHKKLTYTVIESCAPCSGSGIKRGQKTSNCPSCGGSGQVRVFSRKSLLP
jgi:molecular chaperone DnaJ